MVAEHGVTLCRVLPAPGRRAGQKGPEFTPMGAWGIPPSTRRCCSSGVTVTWAHWALLKNNRLHLNLGLAARFFWDSSSSASRPTSTTTPTPNWASPWAPAPGGATFFMLTGFHGFHVTLGPSC